tara:strand:+ start:877 stop:1170 length:294 start_codon:yes stop_codon:yes gene_type:complete
MERGETLYDIELPGFTLREHGWKVLKYDHGVVLARLIHEKFIEYGTWEPNHDGSLLVSGDYVFGPLGTGVPEDVLVDFTRRAKGWALRRFREIEKEE